MQEGKGLLLSGKGVALTAVKRDVSAFCMAAGLNPRELSMSAILPGTISGATDSMRLEARGPAGIKGGCFAE